MFGVTAEAAVSTARRLADVSERDRARIDGVRRRAGSARRACESLRARPITSLTEVHNATGLSFPTVSAAMKLLIELDIARELTGRRRNRIFAYDRYFATSSAKGLKRQ